MQGALSLIAGVRLETSQSSIRLVGFDGELSIGGPSPGDFRTVRNLTTGLLSHRQLVSRTLARDGLTGVRFLQETLGRLIARGWLAERISDRGCQLVTAIPMSVEYEWELAPTESCSWVLSRFAYIRRDKADLVLESPTAFARVVIHDDRALLLISRLFSRLSKTGRDSSPRAPGAHLSPRATRSVTGVLRRAGMLTAQTHRADAVPGDESPPFSSWEFHDLLFHSWTRHGRHRSPYGATYRLEGRVPVPPVFKPRPPGRRVSLAKPDLASLARTDWPLTRALEARRSLRDHAEPPITRRQLGEFLYRTAAIRSIRDDVRYPTTRRVYPSGGAAYALELYVVARRCRGLAPGLYHYGPDRHDLTPVAGMTPAVQSLVGGAAAAARSAPPHILIVMAARFLRAAWKYSSISYALILKDVGALMQTMYLTATAMGLGGCAIGGGDSDLFAKAAGTNYYDESSVGEFILGRVARTKG